MMNGRGFTLLELLIALSIGLFMLGGIAVAYSTIRSTIAINQELAQAQEVIRYTSQLMTRSIKQTASTPQVMRSGEALEVSQVANTPACDGSVPMVDYTETFSLLDGYLLCDVSSDNLPAQRLLRGVNGLSFSVDGLITSITVTPVGVPAQYAAGIQIDVAASQQVLATANW
ncbi:prepilin-type N-terminal cleavage/methylation domain-containing protein [Pseudoalteromonas sp. DL2-H2.2]|uniref:PilW family protein n=1 Tax=Pseudoalteromonas sp. DL2-H2.2 TaxID=2908889 RepID=UPI001F41CAB2|nr:prepilin-type N-terminal cleavage/methylation domain-containing protein [Pseudoalteromonas sp. DL2-H2.2]MCF2910309.1 prepilin-type N-terminal cleavage/methylation domain-containing protein [Pseudoalteromonas sp. DL2-H2.2]